MHVFFKFVVVLAFVQLGYCQDLPVDKCHLEDSVCMTAAFQKAIPIFAGGLPDQGIEVLDVLDLDDVNFDLLGLKGSFTNGKLKGLKTATIDNVTWNTKKKTISVTFHLECGVEGHYKAGGRLLILPVSGEGEAKLKIGRLENNLVMSYTIEKDAKGKDHVILKKLTFDYDVKDNAHVNLTNLFNGKKELSDAMLQFLNENLREIIVEYGRPLMEVTNKKIFKNVKTFLSKNVISDIAYV